MKIAIISHSYLEPENQKNIIALNALCNVRCILPCRATVLLFSDYEFKDSRGVRDVFFAYRPFFLSKAQYLLGSLTLGLFSYNPDVINVEYNPWSAIFFQVLLCRRMFSPKSKIVCTLKKNTYCCRRGVLGKVKDLLARFAIKKVDHVIAASNLVAHLCESEFAFPASKISVCHHLGVDVSLFSPFKNDFVEDERLGKTIVVGYCGRFDSDKGIRDLVEAISLVRQSSGRTVVLRLMGCGVYADSLDNYLRKKSQQVEWLELLPPVSNSEVAGFLNTLDIFVLPSRVLDDHQEHDAHALLEAMASGVACVGTRSGIIPEIFASGDGILVNPENPYELSEALSFLIRNPAERAMLAKRGRQKALGEFSLNVIANQKCNIFKGVRDED